MNKLFHLDSSSSSYIFTLVLMQKRRQHAILYQSLLCWCWCWCWEEINLVGWVGLLEESMAKWFDFIGAWQLRHQKKYQGCVERWNEIITGSGWESGVFGWEKKAKWYMNVFARGDSKRWFYMLMPTKTVCIVMLMLMWWWLVIMPLATESSEQDWQSQSQTDNAMV